MRKIFSLFAAVLFAGSMMAIDFTLSSAAPVTKEGVTVTFSQGAGSNAPAWYDNGLRLYANNEVTVSSESNITGITFNWQKQGQKAFNTATASTGEYTHPSAAGEGVWTGSAASVTFTLGATGQLLLNTFSVTVGGEPQPTVNYYVVGNMTGWEINEAYKLAANPKVAGEFKGNFTFADFDEFKVVGFDGETKTWYPDGTDNNFQISEQGGDYTVYFRPAGGVEGWYYGFFSVVEKTEPILPQYDVAEAIAAGLAENEEILWQDKKRYLGLPISFTIYSFSNNKFYLKKGIFNISSEEILLYRVLDLTFKQTLWQKIFGVGSVILTTADKSTPVLEIKNIKTPDRVRKALSTLVEMRRDEKRVTGKEMFGAAGMFHDHGDLEGVDLDGDGIADVH